MGIVETDYFGIVIHEKFGEVWINRRVTLRKQMNGRKRPYMFDLKVKFYVPLESLIQKSTKYSQLHILPVESLTWSNYTKF